MAPIGQRTCVFPRSYSHKLDTKAYCRGVFVALSKSLSFDTEPATFIRAAGVGSGITQSVRENSLEKWASCSRFLTKLAICFQ